MSSSPPLGKSAATVVVIVWVTVCDTVLVVLISEVTGAVVDVVEKKSVSVVV